ncbi:MAG: hypothetical protein P4L31_03390 [Candidatus Babeliales bacterium]|nr:hypothetical protein [Candidatus Babeliales bacterium]
MHYFLSCLFLTIASVNSNCNNLSIDLRDQSTAMNFIKRVQKRNYLVHRLEKPIKSLLRFYEFSQKEHHFNVWDFFDHRQNNHKSAMAHSGFSDQFTHPTVKRCMKDVEEKNDVQAVHRLWSDFLSYKYIESDLFVRETITAIVLLYKDLVLHVLSAHIKADPSLSCQRVQSWDTFADEKIDEDQFTGNNDDLYDNFNSIANLLSESYEDGDFVINNNMRFYHIQRLFKSIIVLSKLMTRHARYGKHCMYDFTHLPFSNEAVRFYVVQMKQTQSLVPLFRLWHSIVSYKYIDDTVFLQEVSMLLLIVHRQIAIDFNGAATKDSSSLHDIIQLYEAISTMPIPDLLNSLDVVVDQCIEIIEKYELDSSMSWRSWFKKYWWMPPVVIASVVINVYVKNKIAPN